MAQSKLETSYGGLSGNEVIKIRQNGQWIEITVGEFVDGLSAMLQARRKENDKSD